MAIVKKRSGRIEDVRYMMFFMRIPNTDYVEAVAVMHEGAVDPSWAWTLWTLDANADEIDALAADLESDNPQYDTQGFSETFGCLEDLIEKPVTMFAYPFGHYDDTVVQLLKLAGYKGARTVNSTYRFDLPKDPLILDPTCHYADEKIMDLARQFCESRSFAPQMFYVWGHAYELDGNDDWDRLEELLSYIAQYKDEIWFAGNGQILSYLEACKMLEYSVDGSFVYNPTCTDVDVLTAFGVEEHIAAGKITKLKETSL